MTTQPTTAPTRADEWQCDRHDSIDAVAGTWDALVPRDWPHLRAGFLRAVEKARMVQTPAYFLVRRGGTPVAAALAYVLRLDGARQASPKGQRWIAWVRKFWPGFKWRPLRVCGSAVSNAASGVYLDPRLGNAERHAAFDLLTRQIVNSTHISQAIYFKEFTAEEVQAYAADLEGAGFFAVSPGPGMRLELPWPTFDDYVNAMRKRYRKLIRKDLKMSEGLTFELVDDFAALAPTAYTLYDRVYAQAEYIMEKANAAFFAALAEFDQAKLLVARDKASQEILGVNLLLFGDTTLQNLFIGFDYEQNKRFHTYFSLVAHSLRLALECGCKVCYLGQDSYDFKARLGAKPVPLTAYMKHRIGFVHRTLYNHRADFFAGNESVTHDVFQGDGAADEGE